MNSSGVRFLRFYFVSAALLLGAVCFAWSAGASTVRRVSDDDLVRRSLLIVDARVVQAVAAWNADRTQIHTTVDLTVIEFIKGGLPANRRTIQLKLLGGIVSDQAMAIVGAPALSTGERALLCLRPGYERLDFPFVGLSQGRIAATRDGRTGRMIAGERGVDYSVLLSQFRERVRALIVSTSQPNDR